MEALVCLPGNATANDQNRGLLAIRALKVKPA
jgi:hypothetical protein